MFFGRHHHIAYVSVNKRIAHKTGMDNDRISTDVDIIEEDGVNSTNF